LLQLAGLLTVACAQIAFSIAPAEAEVTKEVLKLEGKNRPIAVNSWSDGQAAPRAVLISIHGGVQHGGNYTGIAERLAPQGILVYSLDLRGHGEEFLTSDHRPKLDYKGSTEDVVAIAEALRLRHPRLPIFCVGESLGASIALKALDRKPKLFDGLILASVGMSPVISHHIGATWQNIGRGFKTLGGTIDLTGHVKVISDDPRSCDEMIADPLCRKRISVGDMLHALNFMHGAHRLMPVIDPDVPVLVLQGLDDHIIHASSTKTLFAKLPTRDKSMITFPGCGHLVVTTRFLKPAVVEGVQNWLFAHSQEPPLAVTATQSPAIRQDVCDGAAQDAASMNIRN
jgi:acylglycerol lipase